jgi:hypothetical protein
MKYSVYTISPFNSNLNIKRTINLLDALGGLEFEYKGSIPVKHSGSMTINYFDNCHSIRKEEFCLFVSSFPLEHEWYILRNHLSVETMEYINKSNKWIAATTDLIEELCDIKNLDLDRAFAFNLYKAVRTSDWIERGLSYEDEIYTYGIEDSSFMFCEDKNNFLSVYNSARLGERLTKTLLEHKFTEEEIQKFNKDLSKLKGNSSHHLIYQFRKSNTKLNIVISIVFGTLASLFASVLYSLLGKA